jgi:hypothetical protein
MLSQSANKMIVFGKGRTGKINAQFSPVASGPCGRLGESAAVFGAKASSGGAIT